MAEKFSFEDFEKGLMLAGFITPSSITELREVACLQEYEKSLKKQESQTYFKRAVLAAEIVEQLHTEPSLGKVKFQKLVYLCEHIAEMGLEERYDKQAAGPFDNKFMHSIGKEFRKQKWFNIEKLQNDNYTRYIFTPLEKHQNYKSYYNSYFSDMNERIQYVIELFRKERTEFTELAATVFACFVELQKQSPIVEKSALINTFYDWAESKKRFTIEDVLSSFEWLRKKRLIKHSAL